MSLRSKIISTRGASSLWISSAVWGISKLCSLTCRSGRLRNWRKWTVLVKTVSQRLKQKGECFVKIFLITFLFPLPPNQVKNNGENIHLCFICDGMVCNKHGDRNSEERINVDFSDLKSVPPPHEDVIRGIIASNNSQRIPGSEGSSVSNRNFFNPSSPPQYPALESSSQPAPLSTVDLQGTRHYASPYPESMSQQPIPNLNITESSNPASVDMHSWSQSSFSNRNPSSPSEYPASGPSSYRAPPSTVDLQSTRSQHHQGTRPYVSPWINAHANSMSAESNVRMSDQPIPNVNMTASSNLDKFPASLPRTSGLGTSPSSNPASVDTHSLSQNPDNGEIFPDLPPSYEMAMMDETDLP